MKGIGVIGGIMAVLGLSGLGEAATGQGSFIVSAIVFAIGFAFAFAELRGKA